VISKPRRSIAFWIYTGSVGFHAVLGAVTLALPRPKTNEIVAIQLAEAKKKAQPPKPAPPPPPPPPPQEKPKPKPAAQTHQEQAKVAPETKIEALPPVPVGADGFADLGIALGNSDGPGIPVPTGAGAGGGGSEAAAANAARAAKPVATHKVEQLAVAQGAEVCNEPVVKPKRQGFVKPEYTLQARQAEIEGVVRVEVTVDEAGHVIRARVLSGLGYGLDESAVQAAKALRFTPASQCGKPIVATSVIAFDFELT
jgi:periplasmic protein TonB